MTSPAQQPGSENRGLAALVELERALTNAETPRDAGLAIMQATKALFDWDSAYLYLYSPEHNQLHPVIAYDYVKGSVQEVEFLMRAPAKGSFTEKALNQGAYIHQKQSTDEISNPALAYGDLQRTSASLIFCPVPGVDGPVGILSVQSYTPGKYNDNDLHLMKIVTGYCAGAFESRFSMRQRRATEDQFARVLFFAPIGLGLIAPDGQWLKVNPAFCKMLHCVQEDIVATQLQDMLVPSDAARFNDTLKKLVAGETETETDDLEVQMVRQNGSRVRVTISIHIMRDQVDAPVHFVLHFQDVTGERRHNQVQKVFRSLGQKLLGAVTPSEVAFHMLEAADELFEWGCAFIDLYSEKTQRFEAIMTVDEVDGKRENLTPRHKEIVPGSNTEKALKEGAFMILRAPEEIASPGHIVPFGNNRPSASLMYVPMRRGNHNVGVMSIQSYELRVYAEEDLLLLQELADFCSTSFERTFAESKAAQAESSLLESQKRFKMVMRATNDAVYDWNIVTDETWWNEGAHQKFYGGDPETWNGDWWAAQLHPDDREHVLTKMRQAMDNNENSWVGEYRFRIADGGYGSFLDRGYITYENGKAIQMLGSMMDITARKHAEEQLRHGAYHDALTGLPNRAMVIEEVNRGLSRCRRRADFNIGLLFLDLDRFKIVNDSLGHAAGDELLIAVAEAIRECLRPSDLVGRLGGDEFTVLLDDLDGEHGATVVAERILKRLQEPFNIHGSDVYTGASIGIAISSSRYTSADEMLRDADTAMYRAKVSGKGRFALFDLRMHAKVLSALQTENDLRKAVQLDQFVLHYQSVLELSTRDIISFEALIRWNHPERGLLSPAEFITVAEETGLIISIGNWVLRTACEEAVGWKTPANGKPMGINVNVSARQFTDPDFVRSVQRTLEETGLEPSRLNLEITETLLVETSPQRTLDFQRLKSMGINFHLDDFGTGYSSLSYLHKYPIDVLKIDRSFISRFDSDDESREIVRAILAMARVLNLAVIGEGIETEAQLSSLYDLGCVTGQGFLFQKPLPAAAIHGILEKRLNIRDEHVDSPEHPV